MPTRNQAPSPAFLNQVGTEKTLVNLPIDLEDPSAEDRSSCPARP